MTNEINASVLDALRLLAVEVEAEMAAAEDDEVRRISRCELSGVKRAILRAESVLIAAGMEIG